MVHEKTRWLIKIVDFVHTLQMISAVIFLIGLFIPAYQVYSAIYFMIVFILQGAFGDCPLTILQDKLLKKIGQKEVNVFLFKFIENVFRVKVGEKGKKTIGGLWFYTRLLVYAYSLYILIIHTTLSF